MPSERTAKLEEKTKTLSERLASIDSHITIINDELGGVLKTQESIKGDVSWLKYLVGINITMIAAILVKVLIL